MISYPYRKEVLVWIQAKAKGKEVWILEGNYPRKVHFVMDEEVIPKSLDHLEDANDTKEAFWGIECSVFKIRTSLVWSRRDYPL